MVKEGSEKKKIFVGMPIYSQMPAPSVSSFSLFLLHAAKKYNITLGIADSCYICSARNKVVDAFLKTDCEYLLWLDSDMIIPTNILEMLIESDKDIIAGAYYRRNAPFLAFLVEKDGKLGSVAEFPKGVFEVAAAALGCCLVKRHVIEKIAEKIGDAPFFKLEYPSRLEELGEDVYFSRLAKEAGFKIFIDSRLILGHFGGIIGENYYKKS